MGEDDHQKMAENFVTSMSPIIPRSVAQRTKSNDERDFSNFAVDVGSEPGSVDGRTVGQFSVKKLGDGEHVFRPPVQQYRRP